MTIIDEYITSAKWKWTGHHRPDEDNICAIRTEPQIKGVRSAGRHKHCGATGNGIDKDSGSGGLLPARKKS